LGFAGCIVALDPFWLCQNAKGAQRFQLWLLGMGNVLAEIVFEALLSREWTWTA